MEKVAVAGRRHHRQALRGRAGPGSPFGSLAVFARGTDGMVWYRSLGTGGWGRWALLPAGNTAASFAGRLLPGTGPAASGVGALLLAVTGTDRHAWLSSITGTATR